MLRALKIPAMLARRVLRKLGVRVAAYAVLACLVAIAAGTIEGYLPTWLTQRFGPEAVMPVLTILASSMLAVSTFSLNVMVSAHRAAAANATPRIHRLLLEDTTTQSVLASFIGAFVFALTSIILFRARLYPDESAVVVMGVTVLVVIMVIVAMLRWIEHLTDLGSLDQSMRIAYARARDGLRARSRQPALGASPLTPDTVMPDQTQPVPAARSGYVQLVDLNTLQTCAGDTAQVYVTCAPGQHVLRGHPVAQVAGSVAEGAIKRMSECFVIGNIRTHEQDPSFGLTTLSEISSRALSPGVNDPGTAIEAVTRMGTLLWDYATASIEPEPPLTPRVFLPVPHAGDLLNAAFAATARDGAGSIEVAEALQRVLRALADANAPDIASAAKDMADYARDHAEAALTLAADRARLTRM